ncbi:MAG: sigma-54-dependent transcriptional regulator [bacterium]|jgi:DNA-binding NtrC family response regulator
MESTPEEKQSREVHILIVDDDERMAKTIARALQAQGYTCQIALSGDQGLNYVHDQHFDLILTDLVMPGFDGVTFVRSVKAIDPNIPIIMITGHGTIDTAVESMKAGAFHYLTKPIRLQELQVYVNKALDSREMLVEVQELKDRLKNFDRGHRIIGKSQGIRNIITQVEQIAPSTATVLITGETGTGKEIIAETIHLLSPRAHKNMIKVNCGALPESLLESELFGHTKGSFTGAYKDHQGRFEVADGGTIFLDEIGEMSPASQVRLLRVLQEGEFERVGSTKPIQIDVRVIAATNRDLAELVKEGTFRQDLYYRINTFHLEIPPLSERKDDIPLLAQHFIEKYAEKNNKKIEGLGEYAYQALLNYTWPGNVRELENVIEHGVIMAKGDRIVIEDLPDRLQHVVEKPAQAAPHNIVIPLGYSAQKSEGIILRRTLEMTQGDKEAAAKILGYSTRTLYRKMKEHKISLDTGETDLG